MANGDAKGETQMKDIVKEEEQPLIDRQADCTDDQELLESVSEIPCSGDRLGPALDR